jgi:hypothetical protein
MGMCPTPKSHTDQQAHQSKKKVATNHFFPITRGNRPGNWAPSLLARPLGKQCFKLRHLLVEHAIQHGLLVRNLLSELLLEGVLERLDGMSLGSHRLFKLLALLMDLGTEILEIGGSILGILQSGLG